MSDQVLFHPSHICQIGESDQGLIEWIAVEPRLPGWFTTALAAFKASLKPFQTHAAEKTARCLPDPGNRIGICLPQSHRRFLQRARS